VVARHLLSYKGRRSARPDTGRPHTSRPWRRGGGIDAAGFAVNRHLVADGSLLVCHTDQCLLPNTRVSTALRVLSLCLGPGPRRSRSYVSLRDERLRPGIGCRPARRGTFSHIPVRLPRSFLKPFGVRVQLSGAGSGTGVVAPTAGSTSSGGTTPDNAVAAIIMPLRWVDKKVAKRRQSALVVVARNCLPRLSQQKIPASASPWSWWHDHRPISGHSGTHPRIPLGLPGG
jgi:hypothetical protein